MGQIIGANKDVTEETLFLGAEIPKYGVVTSHEMELERVIGYIFFFKYITYYKLCLLLIWLTMALSSIAGDRKCEFMGR